MKTIPGAVQTALDLEAMGFSVLTKLTRTDAVVLAFTTHDEPIDHDSVTYLPGLSEGKEEQAAGLGTPSQGQDFLIDSDALVLADLECGLYDHASIEVRVIQHDAPGDGVVLGLKGRLGKTSMGDTRANAEIKGLSWALTQGIGRTFTKACPFDLGDADCKVVLASFTVTGTVTSVTDNRVIFDTGRLEADDTFNLGLLTWTSGLNVGLAMEVKQYTQTGGQIDLVLPMAKTVAPGDTYNVYQGCDKTATTCKNVFSNLVNHGGFPFVPGATKHLKTGSQ